MKKVGIVTFHYANNYGAVLQTYALRKKINSYEGYCAEIINYVPKDFTYALYGKGDEKAELLKNKRKKFEAFLERYCGICSPMISTVTGKEYDYYCAGSDQIWNNSYGYLDEEFFLANVSEEAVKISYAASVGMKVERARLLYEDTYAGFLKSFKALSVREEEHKEFISRISGKPCSCVVDPTLLLDAADYDEILAKKERREKEFVFFFWINNNDDTQKGIHFANVIAKKFHLQVVHNIVGETPYMFWENGGCMMGEGVEEFLWYIKNATYVVTNSYHATLFSMQFRTPFYTFVVKSMRSRIDTLLQRYDIASRVIEEYIPHAEIHGEIDFESIHQAILKERAFSLEYLEDALDIGR